MYINSQVYADSAYKWRIPLTIRGLFFQGTKIAKKIKDQILFLADWRNRLKFTKYTICLARLASELGNKITKKGKQKKELCEFYVFITIQFLYYVHLY